MRGSTVWHCLLVDFPKNTNNTTSKSQLIKLFKMLRGYMQYDTQQGKKKQKKQHSFKGHMQIYQLV